MADETKPLVTDTPAPGTEATVAETKPAQDTQAELPEKYKGKSPAELAAILDEKEKFIGRQADEVGKFRQLESEVGQLRDYLGNLTTILTQGRQEQQPREPEPKEEFDFVNPDKWFNRKIAEERKRWEQEQTRRDGQRYVTEAQTNFSIGKGLAYKQNPRLYEGIEKDVEAFMFNAAKGGLPKEQLTVTENWDLVAKNIRMNRGEFDRIMPQTTKGMTATDVGTPAKPATRDPYEDDVLIDDDTRDFMRKEGISEKDAVEIIRSEQQAARKGLNRRPR